MEKVLIVYTSTTGNTQIMAETIRDELVQSGIQTELQEASASPALEGADGILFGCPAMGAEMLEENEFEPYFSRIEDQLAGKTIALFGSYGWGDGQWMRDWHERCQNHGALIMDEDLILNGTPDEAGLRECREFAERFIR